MTNWIRKLINKIKELKRIQGQRRRLIKALQTELYDLKWELNLIKPYWITKYAEIAEKESISNG